MTHGRVYREVQTSLVYLFLEGLLLRVGEFTNGRRSTFRPSDDETYKTSGNSSYKMHKILCRHV